MDKNIFKNFLKNLSESDDTRIKLLFEALEFLDKKIKILYWGLSIALVLIIIMIILNL